jgi:hypothetical protein
VQCIHLACAFVNAGKEVEDTLRIVDAQTQEAAAKKQVVEGEEAIASEKAAAAKAIKVKVAAAACWNYGMAAVASRCVLFRHHAPAATAAAGFCSIQVPGSRVQCAMLVRTPVVAAHAQNVGHWVTKSDCVASAWLSLAG